MTKVVEHATDVRRLIAVLRANHRIAHAHRIQYPPDQSKIDVAQEQLNEAPAVPANATP